MQHGLNDLRIIDFSDTIAGSYATRLLVDAGAEVIKVEPVAGDSMQSEVVSLPRRDHVPHPIQEQLIIELCSK